MASRAHERPGPQESLMPKRSSTRLDSLAWLLLLSGFAVAACVFSYEPSAREGAAPNLLGTPGEMLARELHAALGSAVYVLLASWFVLVLTMLVQQSWLRWSGRLVGWLLLVPASAMIADWLGPSWLAGPVAGSGGAIGASLRALMFDHFPGWPGVLLLSSAVIIGLLLAVGFILRFCIDTAHRIYLLLRSAYAATVGRLRRRERTPQPELILYEPEDDIEYEHEAEEIEVAEAVEEDDGIPIVRLNAAVPAAAHDDGGHPLSILPISRTPGAEEPNFEGYELPPLTLLEDAAPFPFEEHDQKLRDRAVLLEKTFKDFELNVRVVGINTGPVVTQYEIALETGLRVNKVTALADDLALHLKVPSVRIVAPIPGKNTVGIELPNENRANVHLKELILSAGRKAAKMRVPLFLGKDTEGRPLVYDLADMPHLLIAGATGTGKSVCMNSLILSMLMTRRPDEVKMIMIDPKMNEMTEYSKIPHLMHPVVKDMKKAEAILAWAVDKMEERYDLLSRARVRHVSAYNELGKDEIVRRLQPEDEELQRLPEKMPYIVILVDELGDLMMLLKREVEGHIIRLAQKSRAAGIHLILATQKPTVDVVTGLIKSNLPGRICFRVSSRTDSRVVLDEMGAERLLGKGDMLFLQPGTSSISRAQGSYASDGEIQQVVSYLECDEPCYATELVQLKPAGEGGSTIDRIRARDELYEQAIEIVVREGRGSVSLLQRALGIGYGRAARMIDFMAEDGIVGVYNGSNAREVVVTPEEWAAMRQGAAASV
jgi:S-DNA-T family DNA segregation ATPase FtsK/SpoIIIE